MFKDEQRLVTRSLDDTMKLWDIRNTKEPVHFWKDLTNLSPKTNICFSPDERLVITGTSVSKGFGSGLMMGFDAVSGEKVV
jgi:WD40 repeat protein